MCNYRESFIKDIHEIKLTIGLGTTEEIDPFACFSQNIQCPGEKQHH